MNEFANSFNFSLIFRGWWMDGTDLPFTKHGQTLNFNDLKLNISVFVSPFVHSKWRHTRKLIALNIAGIRHLLYIIQYMKGSLILGHQLCIWCLHVENIYYSSVNSEKKTKRLINILLRFSHWKSIRRQLICIWPEAHHLHWLIYALMRTKRMQTALLPS